MNPEQLLQQLKPLHSPLPPGWWPLAPGWWIVIILGLLVLGGLGIFIIRRYQRNLWRRQALLQLASISTSSMDSKDQLLEIQKLIKQVSRHRYADQPSNALTGKAWIEFLSQQTESKKLSQQDLVLLSEGLYRPEAPTISNDFLLHIKQWIKAGS